MSSESTEVWTGWYRDRRGAESIAITVSVTTQGREVRTRIRGNEYEGPGFAALCAVDSGEALSGCVLEWDLPLPVALDGVEHRATLSCLLSVGEHGTGDRRDRVDLSLTLHFGGAAYESGIAGGDFDEALGRIRRQLPEGAEFGRRLLASA
ncbi:MULTISPECIES: DUF6304 family protein [unclassified Streptomyces]|uniref:DUF6304 family protein n=1 Tax=unclassified Streptomyces TaxID=2593676 RepID=UPI0021C5E88B|nr:DUF6304 family protein [Streptomyces sp. FIT100]UUN29118.1 hypothetical protein KK483_24100 [Streptomyces sp. FIT100]